MSTATADITATVKFHTSLNVTDLDRSIKFYRLLFGLEPNKCRPDYAKFELDQPPLVLSLIPSRVGPRGNLNHLGLRMRSSEELVEIQMRLEAGGIRTKREEGVECCYAKQTKFWIHDPDNALWEIYVLHEDIDEHGHGHVPTLKEVDEANSSPEETKVTWEHHLSDVIPSRIPHEDNSVHEVYLHGAANLKIEPAKLRLFLAEAFRVLRPGGEVRVHGLSGDLPLPIDLPPLPGPASAVQHVPSHSEPVQLLTETGFVDLRFEKLSQTAHFNVGGVGLRESLIFGRKPGHRPAKKSHQAIYLGPMAQVADDFGNTYRRGEPAPLNVHDWQVLSKGVAANQFLFP